MILCKRYILCKIVTHKYEVNAFVDLYIHNQEIYINIRNVHLQHLLYHFMVKQTRIMDTFKLQTVC